MSYEGLIRAINQRVQRLVFQGLVLQKSLSIPSGHLDTPRNASKRLGAEAFRGVSRRFEVFRDVRLVSINFFEKPVLEKPVFSFLHMYT